MNIINALKQFSNGFQQAINMISIDNATTLLYLTTKLEETLHLLQYYYEKNDDEHFLMQKKNFLALQQQIASFVKHAS